MSAQLSRALTSLVSEAQGCGFAVTHAGNCVTIYKARGKTVTLGVMIFTSATGAFFQAIRADTRLDACTAIRTIKGVRRALEIGLTPAMPNLPPKSSASLTAPEK